MFNFFSKKNVDKTILLEKANVLYLKKKYASAIKYYTKILKVDSSYLPALANIATAYFELQKFDKAIPFFQQVIIIDKDNPWWYNYLSQSMQKCGNLSGALENAWQAVLLDENDNAHHLNLAYTIYEIFDEEGQEKIDFYLKKWYEKYPQNPIAEQCFKSYFHDKNFSRSNLKYVEELFDVFASDFDSVLNELEYDSPKIIAQYLQEFLMPKNNDKISILDLGCGSGLCGKYIKKIFKKSRIVGVDISAQMLKTAKAKNVYDELVRSDITDCFNSKSSIFDVVVASDVLTYFGDLDLIFKKVDSVLYQNGVFAFTISENKINNNDYFLMPSSRFVHTQKYVENEIKKYNFEVVKNEKKILRKEGDKEVVGIVYLIQKR